MTTEIETTETPEMDDAEADAAFMSGTGETLPPKPTETPAPDEGHATTQPPATTVAPEYVQLTRTELEQMRADITEVKGSSSTIGKRLDQAFGKLGGMERVIAEQQAKTPSGEAVVFDESDVVDWDEFPELKPFMVKMLNRTSAKMRGTGASPPGLTPQPVAAIVQPTQAAEPVDLEAQVRLGVQKLQAEELEALKPGWRETIGATGSNTEFRKWLSTQPADYADRIANTDSARILSDALDKFASSTKKPAPSNRNEKLLEAVQDKGDNSLGGGGLTADDEFSAGVKKSLGGRTG